jgi:hypothetical protein
MIPESRIIYNKIMNKLKVLILPAILIVISLVIAAFVFGPRILLIVNTERARSTLKLQIRDSARKSDFSQIQSALELYKFGQGSYPSSIPACGTSITGGNSKITYLQKIPCDPLPSPYPSYSYSSSNNGNAYVLRGCLESNNDKQIDSINVAPCNGRTNFSYTLKNP